MRADPPKLLAEFLGTFALVFAGAGAIVINQVSNGVITHVGIALTFGLVILAMIYTFGEISGAHFNPAVTAAFFFARRFSGQHVLPYILAQCGGAIAAAGILRILFSQTAKLGATVPAGSAMQSFILEFILTFVLMLTILRVSTGAKEKGITAGIVVGSVIALEAMFAGPISGASMNPARSLGPALISGHLEHLWIYIISTTLGAAAAVPISKLLPAEINHQAAPHMTPAKTQPFTAPKPEEPRTAQVMPPRAAKRIVGKMSSRRRLRCWVTEMMTEARRAVMGWQPLSGDSCTLGVAVLFHWRHTLTSRRGRRDATLSPSNGSERKS